MPEIQPNYLTDIRDVEVMIEGEKKIREIYKNGINKIATYF